ncbi:MAG TPA: HAD-IA family hydrolase [Bryobacteraceae bacterium]
MVARARPTILFDVMGTLVYNPFFREIPAFFGLTHAEFLRRRHPTSWIEFETGRISEAEYLSRFFADDTLFDMDAFRNCVAKAYRWLDGMESCLADVHGAGNQVYTLSNYPVWFRTIEDKLRLSRYLQWTFVSCETGLRKPAPEAFLSAAERIGRRSADCLLIDDCIVNCAAAEDSGMPAIHFRDAYQLRQEFVRRGLIPQQPGSRQILPKFPR